MAGSRERHGLGHEARRRRRAEPEPHQLLRDADGDGVAETKTVFLDGLNSPFGMALVGDKLYVADTDALLRFAYKTARPRSQEPATKIADLPAGPINHHWTKSLAASPDGSRLYVGVGSNSNAGENGLDWEKDRAPILEIDPATGEVAALRLRPAQSRRAWPSSRKPARYGPWSTSATSSATISFPTISPR